MIEKHMRTLLDIVESNSVAALSENTDVESYKARLKDLQNKKRARYVELKQQGLNDQDAFMNAEKEYGIAYNQLLKDMPEAHRAYVDAQNKQMWSGAKDLDRDELSGRSKVEEGNIKQGINQALRGDDY